MRAACLVVRAAREEIAGAGSFSKSDATPVTVADMAAQAVVARSLSASLGPIRLLGEETSGPLRDPGAGEARRLAVRIVRAGWADADESAVLDAIDLGRFDPEDGGGRGFWTLDPIDGTKGYLRHPTGHYVTALAYIENGRPIVGVMACPTIARDPAAPFDADRGGVLLSAAEGLGSSDTALDDGPARAMRTPRWEERPGAAVRAALSDDPTYALLDRTLPLFFEAGLQPEVLRLDSQAKYALAARGQADVFLRLPRRTSGLNYIWDHAAGAVIASESGCRVTDTKGRPLDFGRGKALPNEGFLVAPPGLHERLLGVLSRREW